MGGCDASRAAGQVVLTARPVPFCVGPRSMPVTSVAAAWFAPRQDALSMFGEFMAARRARTAPSTFAGLGVPAALTEVLAAGGITSPFPIQAATLPDSLAGRDVLGRGRTGS